MSNDHGSSWNPTVIGPFDRCLRCWTPFREDLGYCAMCGKASLVFTSYPQNRGQRCSNHPETSAQWTCCLCRKPICEECCDHVIRPITSIGQLWHCRKCVNETKAIEAGFFETLRDKNCCAKHRDVVAAFTCKKCGIQLCLSCTYFTVKGIFKKRPDDGSFCLMCFRMAAIGHNRNKWFSGHDVAPALL